MNSTIDLCQKLGHSVESTKINFSSEEISLAIITIISSNVSYAVKSQSDQTGREVLMNILKMLLFKWQKMVIIFLLAIM